MKILNRKRLGRSWIISWEVRNSHPCYYDLLTSPPQRVCEILNRSRTNKLEHGIKYTHTHETK